MLNLLDQMVMINYRLETLTLPLFFIVLSLTISNFQKSDVEMVAKGFSWKVSSVDFPVPRVHLQAFHTPVRGCTACTACRKNS